MPNSISESHGNQLPNEINLIIEPAVLGNAQEEELTTSNTKHYLL